jgi:hypothetical protein
MRVLNERRATGIYYDATMDVGRVAVLEAPGTVRTRTLAATLLLDAAGFLVGVDVEPDAPGRTIVMLGSHDAVARTVATRVGVCTDHSNAVFEIRIAGAKAAIRANEKNPYV